MSEVIRVIRKQGQKNRDLNQSLKEVLKMIKDNRKTKRKEQEELKKNNNVTR